jgi:hypothetical protein
VYKRLHTEKVGALVYRWCHVLAPSLTSLRRLLLHALYRPRCCSPRAPPRISPLQDLSSRLLTTTGTGLGTSRSQFTTASFLHQRPLSTDPATAFSHERRHLPRAFRTKWNRLLSNKPARQRSVSQKAPSRHHLPRAGARFPITPSIQPPGSTLPFLTGAAPVHSATPLFKSTRQPVCRSAASFDFNYSSSARHNPALCTRPPNYLLPPNAPSLPPCSCLAPVRSGRAALVPLTRRGHQHCHVRSDSYRHLSTSMLAPLRPHFLLSPIHNWHLMLRS